MEDNPEKFLLVGVDYSLTSPAMSFMVLDDLNDRFRVEKVQGCSINAVFKKDHDIIKNWFCISYPKWGDQIFRYNRLTQLLFGTIEKYIIPGTFGRKYMAIEDYSFGSKMKSKSLMQIAENTCIFKNKFYFNNFKIRTLEPSIIKSFAANHGHAKKPLMWEEAQKKFGFSFIQKFRQFEVGGSPSSDIIDSVWILYMLWCEVKIRHEKLEHLSSEEIAFFYKKFPNRLPLVEREFIDIFSEKNPTS